MKYIPYFLIVFLIYATVTNALKKQNIIPDEAIRIRVIANSNEDNDQKIKLKVKEVVSDNMYHLLKNTKSVDEARTIINNNLEMVNSDVDKVLKENNYLLGFNVNYGLNYFPKKEYKGIEYKEGYYESLVVTLGEGKGDNWWCVLFPPVCMIEAEESSNYEYTSLVNEVISKYF